MNLDRAVFWLLLPLTIVQALWLRNRVTRLPAAAGKRQGQTGFSSGFGGTLNLLAIGDSIMDGVGVDDIENSLAVRFAEAVSSKSGCRVEWRIEGESGFDILSLLGRLEEIEESAAADIILISIGVNDVTGLSSGKQWRRRISRLLSTLEQRWPDAEVLFTGLPPMSRFPLPPQPLRFSLGLRSSMLDGIAAEVISGYPNIKHVPTDIDPAKHPFCADGFHPDASTCLLWGEHLAMIMCGSRRTQNEH